MEEGWAAYGNCPECGGKLIKKKNRTGAMATVKHEVANANCNFKFGSVHDGRKKGTERAQEDNGKKAAAATATGDTSTSANGRKSGATDRAGGHKTGAVADGKNDGKNKGASTVDDKHGNEPAKRESYSDRLKRLYS